MRVAKDGSGEFTTIQEAIDSIPVDNKEQVIIHIGEGIYKEKLKIEKPFISLVGADATGTLLTYDDGAHTTFENGESYGTFNSYSVYIGENDFTATHITFENAAGSGDIAGQALAVYVDADRIHFKACRFLGCQDTIFTGPLPPTPIKPGSFKGPKEDAPRVNGRQFYEHCYIEGDVDFIFGSATAMFYGCEIFSKNRNQEVNGYITAPSTPEGQPYGYVFEKCKLTSDCEAETVYLGRPWRDYGQTTFINCEMGAHIKREGWHNWGKASAEENARFQEYKSIGPGAQLSERVKWARILTDEEITTYSKEKVLSGEDGWYPTLV
ncbi:MAG: pectinesterase family protein [Niameybacter sp.]